MINLKEWSDIDDNIIIKDLFKKYDVMFKSKLEKDHWEPIKTYRKLGDCIDYGYEIIYRVKYKKLPTMEEIFNLFWKRDNGVWFKVLSYNPMDKKFLISYVGDDVGCWVNIEWFRGREFIKYPN